MKKKICYFITCLMLITLTGCVKFKGDLNIKKDKSANYSILYAFDTTYLGNQEVLTDENKKTLEEQGFTVTDYNEGNYKGFNLSLKIDNIDKYSTTNDTDVDLSAITEGETSKYLFKIKKGFLKNTYTANFKNESTQNNTVSSTTDNSTITDDNSVDDDFNTDNNTTNPNMDLSDLSTMMSNMDISFTVNLPYSAKSSNATNKSNKDKTLEWKMTDATNLESINFTFELYNMTNIYILVGGTLIVIIILVVLFIILKKKKGKKDDTNLPKVESDNTVPTTKVPNVVQPNIPPTESFTPPVEVNTQPVQPNVQPVSNVVPPVTNRFVPPVTPQEPVQNVTPTPVNPVPTQNTFIPPMNNQPTNTFIPPVNNVPTVEPTVPNIPNSNITPNSTNMPNNSQNDNTLYNQAFNSHPNNNQNNNMEKTNF